MPCEDWGCSIAHGRTVINKSFLEWKCQLLIANEPGSTRSLDGSYPTKLGIDQSIPCR